MTADLAPARAIWAQRASIAQRASSVQGDRAFVAYAIALIGIVVVAPLGRLGWMFIRSDDVAGLLALPGSQVAGGVMVCLLWAAALVVGTSRGPAILPPFLAFVWGTSGLRSFTVFCRRLACQLVVAGALGAALGIALGSSGGLVETAAIAWPAVAGCSTALISVGAWLAGECAPRAASRVATALLGAAVLGTVIGPIRPLLPWSWVAAGILETRAALPACAAAVVAAISVIAVRPLIGRLAPETLVSQAVRWDLAVSHAVTLDLRSMSTTLQAPPRVGRRIPAAVPARSLLRVFLRRGVVGAVRTPGRLACGILLMAAAGAGLSFALSGVPGAPLVALAAGLLAYVGIGALSAGIYQAADAASDLPLFGIRDGELLLLHSVFPAIMSAIGPLAGALLASAFGLSLSGASVSAAVVLGVVTVATRLSDALRGPSPTFLLTPSPSAMGDPMPVLRLVWALDAPILASLFALSLLSGGPGLPAAIVVVVTGLAVLRFLRR